ncbi:MAG TPA: hypothetical protein PK129_01405 [Cellvibrionaceae bacterium]|nr:hypothetical protein [Cellvibrionaceae bacterium]
MKPPLVRYRCDHASGFDLTKTCMIERIKNSSLTIKYFSQIELIEVDDLDLVPAGRLSPILTERAMPARLHKDVKSIFQLHRDMGVPIRYTVLLVFKWLQLDIGAVCAEAGFHRNYLNAALSGKRQASDLIREKMIEKIGLDPWLYAEWLKPTILSQETIALSNSSSKGVEE